MLPELAFQSSAAGSIVAAILFLIAVITAYKSIVIVRAYEKRAYTRFGKYQGLLEPGPNFVLPFVTKTYTFDMRTQTLDVPRQEAMRSTPRRTSSRRWKNRPPPSVAAVR